MGKQRLLHLWVLLTLVATFLLLCTGGIVTSKGVGLAVPDWPTTYGYNMFLFPMSKWVGGIFYEHTHRLLASGVGLMTVIMTVWLHVVDSRRWVKILGLVALTSVCLQGVLGGLRVILYQDEIGIFHALLSQTFFCITGILAVATSVCFQRGKWDIFRPDPVLKYLVLSTTLLIFFQLGLGAAMRHEHAGLAIPDFPLAYGQWIPDTSPQAIEKINAMRTTELPTSALFIWVQMTHRGVAFLIILMAGIICYRTFSFLRLQVMNVWSTAWLVMIGMQAGLGAWTIWSEKNAVIATAHMALGALILLLGTLFSFRLLRAEVINRFWLPEVSSSLTSHIA